MLNLAVIILITTTKFISCGILKNENEQITQYETVILETQEMKYEYRMMKVEEAVSPDPPLLLDDEEQYDEDEDFDMNYVLNFMNIKMPGPYWNFTEKDKKDLTTTHNNYRGNMSKPIPFMSNLNYIEWDFKLAHSARHLSKKCEFNDDELMKHNSSWSQNLYRGYSILGSRPLWKWYEEYKYYDFAKGKCLADQDDGRCEHYELMTFHSNVKVGCGRFMCFPRDLLFIVVCLYTPRPVKDQRMSYYGEPCNACDRDSGGLCYNNLCIRESICEAQNLSCHCNQKCKNCGILNKEVCTCSCKSGWDSQDCKMPCKDVDTRCGKPGGITARECSSNVSVSSRFCRAFCGQCQTLDSNITKEEKQSLCCNGKVCKTNYVLDVDRCECVLDCPGPQCMFNETMIQRMPGPDVGSTACPQIIPSWRVLFVFYSMVSFQSLYLIFYRFIL